MKTTHSGAVLGVDVGWSEKRASSAVCRLEWVDGRGSWLCRRFRAIADEREKVITEVAAGHTLLAAAFDGPLRAGFDRIGLYRSAERMLTRRLGMSGIGKPGQSNSPNGMKLNDAANECAMLVVKLGLVVDATHATSIHRQAIVEAFPTSFLGVMLKEPIRFITHPSKSDAFYENLSENGVLLRLLHHCLPFVKIWPDFALVTNHDDRAALTCALTALCVARGSATVVGDEADGWILLPPRELIQPWAIVMLQENARAGYGDLRWLSTDSDISSC